jgi:hypothetical protein
MAESAEKNPLLEPLQGCMRQQCIASAAVRHVLAATMDSPWEQRSRVWSNPTVRNLRKHKPGLAWPDTAPNDSEIIRLLRRVHHDDAIQAMGQLLDDLAQEGLRAVMAEHQSLDDYYRCLESINIFAPSALRQIWDDPTEIRLVAGEFSPEQARQEWDELIRDIEPIITAWQARWKTIARERE